MRPVVTIYGKPGCCLCDEAIKGLEEVRQSMPFEIEHVDISGDAELAGRYGLDIPVIFINGRDAFKHRIDSERL
ncbi:MAG TPA: glutaredoxin family protein, partial [Chlorobaculum parvum]|nr:glutaredoxin family protein [Chlorobaculum parvum]